MFHSIILTQFKNVLEIKKNYQFVEILYNLAPFVENVTPYKT